MRRSSAPLPPRRTLTLYVRHLHRYYYRAATPPPSDSQSPDVSTSSDVDYDSDSGVAMGYQLGQMVSQHRDEYVLCPHNFFGAPYNTPEYRTFLRDLPHNRRDCRPCSRCFDVCFRHAHPCPPTVLVGTSTSLETFCTPDCVIHGVHSRPYPIDFRRLHNCPWGENERDPLVLRLTYFNPPERRVRDPSLPRPHRRRRRDDDEGVAIGPDPSISDRGESSSSRQDPSAPGSSGSS
jgi:hypothetical protein